jgi:hypothetical protein
VKKFLLLVPTLLTLAVYLSACGNGSAAPGDAPSQKTPLAQNTPATQNAGSQIYAEDFSKKDGGWTQLSNDSGSIAYAGGRYTISVKSTGALLIATPGQDFPGDVSIEVDARKTGGSDDNYIGILCHYLDPDNYYLLIITSDGYSGIAMRKAGEDSLISPNQKFLKMDGIKTGNATNHIRADCIGEQLTLYANGKQVNLAYNDSLTGGTTGLVVRSGKTAEGTEISFDNFTVFVPAKP